MITSTRAEFSIGWLRWHGFWKDVLRRIGPLNGITTNIYLMNPVELKSVFSEDKMMRLKKAWSLIPDYAQGDIMHDIYYNRYYPKESPLNVENRPCDHCAVVTPVAEMIKDGHRLFCSTTCRAAAEIMKEWNGD